MPYVGKKPADIIATAVDTTTGTFSGVVDADAGITVDNITIDGTEIDLSSGDLTVDVAGDITLDADGGNVIFSDATTTFGRITNTSSDLALKSDISDKDIIFKGNDGGSVITALRLDMSDAGTAIFNHDIKIADNNNIQLGAGADLMLSSDGTHGKIANLQSNGDIIFEGNDGGSTIEAVRFDMSDGGSATFNHDVSLADNGKANFGSSADFQIYHDSSNAYLRNELQDSDIIFQGNDGGSQVEVGRFDVSSRGFAVGTYNSVGLHTMVVGGATGGNATFKAGNTSTSGNTTCILAFMDGSGSASVNSAFLQGFNGSNNFYLLGNGTHTFTSDENAKKNIETTRDGYLEDLAKLRVVKYNWKEQDDSEDKELGLIAQEVETVFPKLVMLDIDPQIEDADKKKMIKTTVLPFMLLKGLQEANTKIEALKTENATQSTQIADLISRIVTLENA